MVKKITDIRQLRGVLRKIIITQDPEEIKNFNTLYDYSNITDMSNLWEEHLTKLLKKKIIDWKNIKFPTLDMINVEIREEIFKNCPLFEINLINTQNVKNFYRGFEKTKNLEKINLDLIFCEKRNFIFYESNVKEIELLNTQNVKELTHRFRGTENLEKISLNLNSCENRNFIFYKSNVKEVELKNTQNVKELINRFSETKNLEKLNDLYIDNCENMELAFEKSNIKEVGLYNTGNVRHWFSCFEETKIEEIELDMEYRENCFSMFSGRKIKKIELKNTQGIEEMGEFIQGCENLESLKIDLSNVKNITDFINEKNNIKYLEISGLEEYFKNHIEYLEENLINREKIEEFEKIKNNKDLYGIFLLNKKSIEYYKNNPILYIEETTKKISNIISENNIEKIIEKKEKEKERRKKIKNKNEKKLREKKTQKEYNLEINL